MSSPRECRTKLIPDTPATQDNFSILDTTSPHKKVAIAIANLIRSDEEGGKSIGLEGGWGSGKTTIVSILCDELKQNLNHKVVLFDAWAHEGDPLRRTFLENLIERLTEEGDDWVQKAHWDEQKEILAQRKEIKETKSDPHIGRLGYIIIPLLALIPIGSALMGAALKDLSKLDFHQPYSTEIKIFILSIALITSPLAVVVIAAILLLVWSGLKWLWRRLIKMYYKVRKEEEKLRRLETRNSKPSSSVWGLLVNRTITGETTRTNKTANPTSLEFESYFADLMKEALVKNDANKKRKIVLVLDNLDRIHPTEALKILSTLQTFLNPRAKDSDAWHKRVWVLIPYDFEGLSQLWGKEKSEKKEYEKTHARTDINEANATTQPAIVATKPNDSQQLPTENVVALSFLDKSFQLRFEVPPPVLSRWRRYLENLMKEAFEDHRERFENDPVESEELHNVYTLYAWYLRKTNRLPTPRQLKLYVNQIGVIHRQWQDEFPFSHMAYYVLLRRMGCNVVEMVRNGELPTSDVEGFIAPDAALNLSALAFNTTVAEAKQIILENPIQEDFETRNPDSLKALYQTHQDKGFWEAFERMVQANWQHYSSVQLAKAAYCLDRSELFKQQLPQSAQLLANSVKRYFRKSAEAVQDWGPLDTQIAEGITSLCELYPEESLARSILKTISSGITFRIGEHKYRPIDYSLWSGSIKAIKETLERVGITEIYSDEFITPIQKRLSPPQRIPETELKLLLECLCELSLWDRQADEVLFNLAITEDLLYYLSLYSHEELISNGRVRQKNPLLMALCLSIFLLKNPYLSRPSAKVSDEGYDLLIQLITGESYEYGYNFAVSPTSTNQEQSVEGTIIPFTIYFCDFLTKHRGLNNFFEIYKANNKTESFIIECLKIVASNENTPYVFTPEIIEREWHLFSKITKGEFNASPLDKLVKRSIVSHDFVEDVCATTFNPELARLYSSMALQGAEKSPRFPAWITSGLQSISKEMWIAEIDKDFSESLVRLLTSIPYLRNNFTLPAYRDALVEIAIETISLSGKNKRSKITSAGEADSLIGYAGSDAVQTEVRQKIYDIAIEAHGELSEEFLRVFGNVISDADLLYNEAGTFSGLLTPLLKTENPSRQDWVADVLKVYPDLFDQHSDSVSVREFRQLVRHKLKKFYSGKNVIIKANETKPPTVSIPLGKDGEFWIPPMVPLSTEISESSDPSGTRYEVDPITAAFAIHSGWFEETSSSPYSWNSPGEIEKDLSTNNSIMDIAIISGVMPNVNSGIDTKLP
jgi:hypothetical protein